MHTLIDYNILIEKASDPCFTYTLPILWTDFSSYYVFGLCQFFVHRAGVALEVTVLTKHELPLTR